MIIEPEDEAAEAEMAARRWRSGGGRHMEADDA